MNKNLRAYFLLASCIFLTFLANAQEEKHYTCYRTSSPVTADGILAEPDWDKAAWSSDFADITGSPKLKPGQRTRVKMLWDDSCLYIAAELSETDIWATIRKRDEVIFQDNDFEVFLDPDGKGHNYIEIEVNALGTEWDLMLTKPYKDGGKPISSWDLEGLKTGIGIQGSLNDPHTRDTCWIVEMALPLAGLVKDKNPLNKPGDGVQWRLNFSRVEWETEVKGAKYRKKTDPVTRRPLPENNWTWSPMGEVSMHIPSRWGWLQFSSENISPAPLIFRDTLQKKNFSILAWMGGHADWKQPAWDSALLLMKKSGVSCILTQASPATLSLVIPLARKYGIRVETWFVAMMNNDKELIRDHPDWFVVNKNGESSVEHPAYVGYYRFLCPSNPDVRAYLEKRIGEYLDIPGLDGIHLDYIRYPDVILPQALWQKYNIIQDREYPQYDYCYCDLCREKFRMVTGQDPMTLEEPYKNERWVNFRYNQVTSLVSELSTIVHSKGKKLSAAVFPGPSLAMQLVRQDWAHWPLDEVMPMLYQNFYFGSLDWIRSQTAEGVSALGGSAPLYSGLFIPSLDPREFQSAISKSIQGGATGICLFNYEAMTAEHWRILKSVFH